MSKIEKWFIFVYIPTVYFHISLRNRQEIVQSLVNIFTYFIQKTKLFEISGFLYVLITNESALIDWLTSKSLGSCIWKWSSWTI